MRGVATGTAWKIAALGAKAAFLVWVVPRLAAGEFARYMFVFTVVLLAARAASLGLPDQLPVELARGNSCVKAFASVGTGLAVAGTLMLLLAVTLDQLIVLAVALWAMLVAGALLVGLTRLAAPGSYESWANLPQILLVVFAMAGGVSTAFEVLALFGTGSLVSLVIIMASRWRKDKLTLATAGLQAALQIIPRGLTKMLSDFTQLATMRGQILWPKLLGGALGTDRLAYALAVAEAVSTLPMVAVNRNFMRYCNESVAERSSLRTALVIVAGMSFLALGSVVAGNLVAMQDMWRPTALDFGLVAAQLVLFGAVVAATELRVHHWSRGHSGVGFILVYALVFLLQGACVALLTEAVAAVIIAAAAAMLVVGWITLRSLRPGAVT